MKKLFVVLALCFSISVVSFAQEVDKYSGKIQKVTVFQTQAQIEKTVTMSLKQGLNEVIITGNSANMQAQSLMFTPSGDFIIMDFAPYVQYVQQTQTPEDKLPLEEKRKLKQYRDSIENIGYKLDELQAYIDILNQEKNSLSKMTAIAKPELIDTLPELKNSLAYYREKMLEVTSMLQKKNREKSKLNELEDDLTNRINLILQGDKTPKINRNEYFVKLSIYAEKAIPNAKIEYKYAVTGVSWQPIYDVKFTKPGDPAVFVLKAQVAQNTGEDWNDIKLLFSTEQPNNRKMLGALYPYYLSFHKPQPQKRYKKAEMAADYEVAEEVVSEYKDMAKMSISALGAATNYTALTVSQLTMLGKEYEVGMKHTIVSDGKVKIIPLETKRTKADYKHYSIPKVEKAVYISALMPNWTELDIIDAKGKIYLENNYINDTYLSPEHTVDTLALPIGQDKRVVVDRKIDRSKPEKVNLLGSTMEATVTITLTVKNNNQTKIELGLQDQIPLSTQEDIKITAEDTAKANYDDKTGMLKWDMTLNPLESKTIKFVYKVKYPKDAALILN